MQTQHIASIAKKRKKIEKEKRKKKYLQNM